MDWHGWSGLTHRCHDFCRLHKPKPPNDGFPIRTGLRVVVGEDQPEQVLQDVLTVILLIDCQFNGWIKMFTSQFHHRSTHISHLRSQWKIWFTAIFSISKYEDYPILKAQWVIHPHLKLTGLLPETDFLPPECEWVTCTTQEISSLKPRCLGEKKNTPSRSFKKSTGHPWIGTFVDLFLDSQSGIYTNYVKIKNYTTYISIIANRNICMYVCIYIYMYIYIIIYNHISYIHTWWFIPLSK